MKSSLSAQIREQLRRYLAGAITLAELDGRLGPMTWNVQHKHDPTTADLTYAVELCLAEYAHGDWTEDELKELLRPLLDPAWISPYKPAQERA